MKNATENARIEGQRAYANGQPRIFPMSDYVTENDAVGTLDINVGRAWLRGWDAANLADES